MFPNTVGVFISHADEERTTAAKVKEMLASYKINAFVAHDDIEGGDEWIDSLPNAINECDIFLILLSDKYHKAEFTDHETGIAYCLKKIIIPITIDRTIPYGFMSRYQALKAASGITDELIQRLASRIYFKLAQSNIIECLIDKFAGVDSFDQANKMARLISEYDDSSYRDNINDIATAFLSNRQIREGYRSKSVAERLLKNNASNLSEENRTKLKEYVDS